MTTWQGMKMTSSTNSGDPHPHGHTSAAHRTTLSHFRYARVRTSLLRGHRFCFNFNNLPKLTSLGMKFANESRTHFVTPNA